LNKVEGNKISRKKSVVFPYTSNDQPENEIKKTILFIIASQKREGRKR